MFDRNYTFEHEVAIYEAEGGFEADDAEGRRGELFVLLRGRVGRVVRGDTMDGPVGDGRDDGFPGRLGAERRVALCVGVAAARRPVVPENGGGGRLGGHC